MLQFSSIKSSYANNWGIKKGLWIYFFNIKMHWSINLNSHKNRGEEQEKKLHETGGKEVIKCCICILNRRGKKIWQIELYSKCFFNFNSSSVLWSNKKWNQVGKSRGSLMITQSINNLNYYKSLQNSGTQIKLRYSLVLSNHLVCWMIIRGRLLCISVYILGYSTGRMFKP